MVSKKYSIFVIASILATSAVHGSFNNDNNPLLKFGACLTATFAAKKCYDITERIQAHHATDGTHAQTRDVKISTKQRGFLGLWANKKKTTEAHLIFPKRLCRSCNPLRRTAGIGCTWIITYGIVRYGIPFVQFLRANN